VPEKNSFGFTDILTRDGRLIVDSILQHVGRRAAVPRHALGVVNMILGEQGLRQMKVTAPKCGSRRLPDQE
jgi:hypothetical protein